MIAAAPTNDDTRTAPGAATLSVGMAVALGAVFMAFAAVLLAYAIIRVQAPGWPPPGEAPPPPLWPWPALATAAALIGSAAMGWATTRNLAGQPRPGSPWIKSDRAEMGAAGSAARREEGEYSTYLTDEQRSGRVGSARFGDGRLCPRAARLLPPLLLATVAGVTFMVVQSLGWRWLLQTGVRPDSGLVASVIFALTIFHALHAGAALVFLAPLVVRVGRGGGVRRSSVAAVASFWHLVTVAWLVVLVAVFVA